jgi:probable phosphoglycerate mutase
MPIPIDELRAAAKRTPKFQDAGLLDKGDMRKWVRYWESRGHSVQVDKAHGGLYRCSLKLNRTSRLKHALLKDEPMVYIQRHGTTEANQDDEFRGWEDFELEDKGINEAHEAAEWYLAHGVKPKRIISSPLVRALKTAQIIGAALGVEVETDDRLKPLNVGEFTGKDKDSVWDEFIYYLNNPDEVIPGGESVNGFADRMCDFLDEILDAAAILGPILIVGHTSNVVVADDYLRTGFPGMTCRPEEKDIVAPGGIVAISATRNIFPVFKDVKEETEKEDPEKAKHEEYDPKPSEELSLQEQ